MGILIVLGTFVVVIAAVIGALPQARQHAVAFWGKLLRLPLVAAALTGLTLVVGLLGSVYSADLKQALEDWLPLVKDHPVALFFSLFALIVLIWVNRQALLDQDRERLDADMQNGVAAIRETVTHLPPLDFLVKFRDSYQGVVDLVGSARDLEIDKVLRTILRQVVALTEEWDRPERSYERAPVAYRASIMLYFPVGDLADDGELAAEIERSRQFVLPESLPLEYVDGYLLLQPEFSVVSDGRGGVDKDDALAPLALAVTLPDSARAQINLPGAPAAFASGQPQWVESTVTLVDECIGEDFSERQRAAIRDYYRDNGQQVMSIVSLPLSDAGQRLGVLNLYRNHPRMMRSQRRADEFCALLAPFCVQIAHLIRADALSQTTTPAIIDAEQGSESR